MGWAILLTPILLETDMKTYKLKLEDYKVGEADILVREELYNLLRLPGIYANGVETCDGIILAKSILTCKDVELEINETELALMKKVMDILIARPHQPHLGQVSLGGPRYEELILRVFMLDRE
jgi:hypothetical protein